MRKDDESKKKVEREAVLTTIVGGRPPGTGTGVGNIPRGIEVLIKKASVDLEFRKVLLDKRAEAAHEIGLQLSEAETKMLTSIPPEQLEAIIENTKVKQEHRKIFLGKVGNVMLAAAAGAAVLAVMYPALQTAGVRADRIIEQSKQSVSGEANAVDSPDGRPDESDETGGQSGEKGSTDPNDTPPVIRGIQPDRPM